MALFKWIAGLKGDWSDASSWQNNAVPTATDSASVAGGVTTQALVTTSISVASLVNSGFVYFESTAACDVSGDVNNDRGLMTMNSADVTIGGTLSNLAQAGRFGGALYVDSGFAGDPPSGPGHLTVGAIRNTGIIGIDGLTGAATLDVGSSASFGTAGTVTGTIRIDGNGLLDFAGSSQFTTIAARSAVKLNGANAFLADAGLDLQSNSALRGLRTIDGELALSDGASVTTSGSLTVAAGGEIDINLSGSDSTNTTRLSIGGSFTNRGTLQLVAGQGRVTMASIDNTGGRIEALYSQDRDLELDVAGPASFGTAGAIEGQVFLTSGTRIEFAGSRQLTTLGSAATLIMDSAGAIIADTGIDRDSNSALTGLRTIDGTLLLEKDAEIDTSGRLTVDAAGSVELGELDGGGTLALRAGLINHGRITALTGALLGVGGGLANDGTMSFGEKGFSSEDLLHVAGRTNNNGAMTFRDDTEEFTGDVLGHGTLSIGLNTSLTFDGAVGNQQQFYLSQSDTIGLSHPSDFDGAIHKFGHDDSFLIHAFDANTTFNFVENSAGTGGVLNVADGANGSAHIHMAGAYDNSSFQLTSVSGGVRIASTS